MNKERSRPGFLGNLEEIAAGLGLVVVVILTLYNIFNRYVLERSAVWAPELAGFVFTWVVFIGASAAWKRKMHIGIDVAIRYLGLRAKAAVGLLVDIVLLAFLAYATYLAIEITISSHTRLSPVMRIPFSYIYASATLSFGLMLCRQCMTLARALRRPAISPEP